MPITDDKYTGGFPAQKLPFSKKGKEWRKKHLDWATSRTFFNDSSIRNSVMHKKVNFDLIRGKLNMQDMQIVLNPESTKANFVTEAVQHYPIINSKLNVLLGEESKRSFDFKVMVTNPLAISEKENAKKAEVIDNLKNMILMSEKSDEEITYELEKLQKFYQYEWQDFREIRANQLLQHYVAELGIKSIFNKGFYNAMVNAEEIYQCDIVSGEPTFELLNPLKVRVYRSGYSNRIEDADIVVYEDYWSPGKIIDTFYDVLSEDEIKKLEDFCENDSAGMANYDETKKFYTPNGTDLGSNSTIVENLISAVDEANATTSEPYDVRGNIRVIKCYWKSKRKVKRVKSYDPNTGEELYDFYPENYIIDKNLGEEETIMWINEAWEGTKIGKDIYINMRPRPIQYNRLSNPSKCHFGIIGAIYNVNEDRPYSLVDMMKPYNYLYNAIHDKLNKSIAANWGKIVKLDLAQVPKDWTVEKWLYFAKINKIAVTDSFREGNVGAATGKLVGGFNNGSSGVIDAETGNNIQQNINLLEFIKMEMAEVAGISRQREGQISNRETVGGVERATLQSSHITEWLFVTHEDVKKRALECLVETAKIALRGRSKKFQYILSDGSNAMISIEGDEFAECDYGLILDNSSSSDIKDKLVQLGQAALQNQTLSFSTIMQIYNNNNSISDIQRKIENDERARQESASQSAKQEQENQQLLIKMQNEDRQIERDLKDSLNQRDNDTKLQIAQLQLDAKVAVDTALSKTELLEKIRQFDSKINLDKAKHSDTMNIKREELSLKDKAIDSKTVNTK